MNRPNGQTFGVKTNVKRNLNFPVREQTQSKDCLQLQTDRDFFIAMKKLTKKDLSAMVSILWLVYNMKLINEKYDQLPESEDKVNEI